MQGTIVYDLLKQLNFPPHAIEKTSYGTTDVNKLINARVDFIVQSKEMAKKRLTDNKFAAETLVPQLRLSDGSDFPLCAATSKQTNPKLLAKLNQAFTLFLMQQAD